VDTEGGEVADDDVGIEKQHIQSPARSPFLPRPLLARARPAPAESSPMRDYGANLAQGDCTDLVVFQRLMSTVQRLRDANNPRKPGKRHCQPSSGRGSARTTPPAFLPIPRRTIGRRRSQLLFRPGIS
jgi:hypothetical protein